MTQIKALSRSLMKRIIKRSHVSCLPTLSTMSGKRCFSTSLIMGVCGEKVTIATWISANSTRGAANIYVTSRAM